MEERSLLHRGVVAIKKEAFVSPSTKFANFILHVLIELKLFRYWLFIK